jgi:hypothetical protein
VDVYVHATFHRDNMVHPVRLADVRESYAGDYHKKAWVARRNAPGIRPSLAEAEKAEKLVEAKPAGVGVAAAAAAAAAAAKINKFAKATATKPTPMA